MEHESEGYPEEVDVPSYRMVGISYSGTFADPFGSGLNNVSIPTYLVDKYAGIKWTKNPVRESVSGVEELLRMSAKNGGLGIDASNLILLLQGKVYKDIRASIYPKR